MSINAPDGDWFFHLVFILKPTSSMLLNSIILQGWVLLAGNRQQKNIAI